MAAASGRADRLAILLRSLLYVDIFLPSIELAPAAFCSWMSCLEGIARQYLAAFYAWAGITGAAGAMFAGRSLQNLQAVLAPTADSGMDAYTVLFYCQRVHGGRQRLCRSVQSRNMGHVRKL